MENRNPVILIIHTADFLNRIIKNYGSQQKLRTEKRRIWERKEREIRYYGGRE